MKRESNYKVTISGSFKFKPEIDLAIQAFNDHGIEVLSPKPGWLYLPKFRVLTLFTSEGFRPLHSEVHMSVRDIEDSFLGCITNSDCLYVVNPNGYIGNSVAFELGFAMALGIPICCQEPVDPNLDLDPIWKERISQIQALPIPEVVKLFQAYKEL